MPVSLGFLLFVGIIISFIQIKQTKNIRIKADNFTSASELKDCSVPSDQLEISLEEQNLLDQINAYRQQQGLNALTWSDSLIRAASWMSNDMLTHKSLSHIDSLGRKMSTRLTNCGYTPYISVGENLDSGAKDSTTTFQAWKHSPPHNANLLNNNYKEAGIAFAYDSTNNSYYWTLNVGSRTTSTTSPPPSSTITKTPTPLLSPIISPTSSGTPSPQITPSPTRLPSSPLPTRLPTKPYATSTPTLTPTPTIDPSFSPNPLDMQLFITAKLIGIGEDGNRNPKHMTRYVTVGIYDLKNNLVTEGNGFIVYDKANLFQGIIHFGPVVNNTYFIKVLSEHMLRAVVTPTFQVLDSNRLNILPQVTLVQGDINEDNVIDITDYNLSLPCFQDKRCQDKNLIDFNDDGLANIVDYNILLQNYRESQGD